MASADDNYVELFRERHRGNNLSERLSPGAIAVPKLSCTALLLSF